MKIAGVNPIAYEEGRSKGLVVEMVPQGGKSLRDDHLARHRFERQAVAVFIALAMGGTVEVAA